jgi:hypothetical protein
VQRGQKEIIQVRRQKKMIDCRKKEKDVDSPSKYPLKKETTVP